MTPSPIVNAPIADEAGVAANQILVLGLDFQGDHLPCHGGTSGVGFKNSTQFARTEDSPPENLVTPGREAASTESGQPLD